MVDTEWLYPYFLDSSALVKLVVDEPGSEVLQAHFRENIWFATSPLCIAEALNVLKRKWSRKELTNQQYYSAAWKIVYPLRDRDKIQLIEKGLDDAQTFSGAQAFSNQYGVDLADALQLYLMIHGDRTLIDVRPGTVYISADAKLISAARKEGLRAWDCVKEPSPPAQDPDFSVP